MGKLYSKKTMTSSLLINWLVILLTALFSLGALTSCANESSPPKKLKKNSFEKKKTSGDQDDNEEEEEEEAELSPGKGRNDRDHDDPDDNPDNEKDPNNDDEPKEDDDPDSLKDLLDNAEDELTDDETDDSNKTGTAPDNENNMGSNPDNMTPAQPNKKQIFRFRSTITGDHMLSVSETEGNDTNKYVLEGPVFQSLEAEISGKTVPILRCLIGTDHFTTNATNCENQTNDNHPLGFAFDPNQPQPAGTVPLIRCNSGPDHMSTISPEECDAANYQREGNIGYVYPNQ